MEDMTRVPYASVVGSLMYAMVCTRPYITQAVGVQSWFMANPKRVRWDAVKRVFRYLRGTSEYSLCFYGNPTGPQHSLSICGYVDSNWTGDIDNRRSISGYVFRLFGGVVSWMSKRQVVITFFTTGVEYMVATHACKEAIWLKKLCLNIGFDVGHINICCDSQCYLFSKKSYCPCQNKAY
ncbi:secreted RxLR effector protein 161-like [Cryptomeria japonica]|uniref:secreted RxLR effector protein 161-like n=1 Tax=Cryptomeria japonica TaxID=3369 RepID=UPI0027DA079D|nr:secreted RxLR effector protein 161-like [Cryptomeria japonica]